MKRWICLLLGLSLLLSGCSAKLADHTQDGAPWQESWTAIGTEVGIADTDLTLYEYNDVQGLDGIYYALWVKGEGKEVKNADGKDAELFPAQMYLLTQECLDEKEAAHSVGQWKAVGETSYSLTEAEPLGEFQVYFLEVGPDSPFVGGLLALGTHDGIAISAEYMYTSDFSGDSRADLEAFLAALRFRAQEG